MGLLSNLIKKRAGLLKELKTAEGKKASELQNELRSVQRQIAALDEKQK